MLVFNEYRFLDQFSLNFVNFYAEKGLSARIGGRKFCSAIDCRLRGNFRRLVKLWLLAVQKIRGVLRVCAVAGKMARVAFISPFLRPNSR